MIERTGWKRFKMKSVKILFSLSLCAFMLVDVKSYNKKSTSNNNNSKNERKNGLEAVPNWTSIDVPVAQRTKKGIACWLCTVHAICTNKSK